MKDKYDYMISLKDSFLEQFEGIEDETGEKNEFYEPENHNITDQLDEIAILCAIPSDSDKVRVWLSMDRPQVEAEYLIREHETNPIVIISIALYEFSMDFLRGLAQEYNLL